MDELKVVKGLRGAENVFYRGFKYSKRRNRGKQFVKWRCSHYKKYLCRGAIKTTLPPYSDPSISTEHTHPPEPAELEVEEMRLDMRQRISDSVAEPVIDMVNTFLNSASDEAKKSAGLVSSIKRDIRRTWGKKFLPPYGYLKKISVGKADVASSSADSALSATCPGSSNERVIIKEEVEVDEESSINQSEQTEDEFMENWEQNDPCDDSNSGNTELGNSNYLERPVSPLEMKRCLKEEEAIKNQDLNNILRTTDIITGLNEMNSKQPKMPVGLMNNRGLHSSTELEDYLKTVIKKQEELININIELARFNLEKAKMEADINLQKMENLKLENQLLKFQLQKEKNNCHS